MVSLQAKYLIKYFGLVLFIFIEQGIGSRFFPFLLFFVFRFSFQLFIYQSTRFIRSLLKNGSNIYVHPT